MPKQITFQNLNILNIVVSPRDSGGFQVTVTYTISDQFNTEVVGKQRTYYSDDAGGSPVLPAGLQTAFESLLNTAHTGLLSVEGM